VGQLANRIAKIVQPLSNSAAALAALAAFGVGVTLIISGLHRGFHSSPNTAANRVGQAATATRPDASRQQPATSTENPQPALAGVPPQNAPAPQTPSSQTQTTNTTASEIPALQTPTPTLVAQRPMSDSAAGTPSAEDVRAQGEEAAARRKRLAESRRQRKAELAQHAAELQAAQLQAQIQVLLVAAKNEYSAGALWQPSGASAADSYRDILKMQPGHAEALAGAQRVANVLAAEAVQTESVGDIYTAKLLIDQIQSLQPSHPKLAELQARLQQLQTKPAVLDSRDRGRLEKASKYIARAEEDLGRTPLDFKAADDATDQYDKALSAAPMAPGLPSLKERLIAAYATATRTEMSNHQPKQALKLINSARKRNWSSDELDQLEASLKTAGAATAPIKEVGAAH
jgi:hypothetical protein